MTSIVLRVTDISVFVCFSLMMTGYASDNGIANYSRSTKTSQSYDLQPMSSQEKEICTHIIKRIKKKRQWAQPFTKSAFIRQHYTLDRLPVYQQQHTYILFRFHFADSLSRFVRIKTTILFTRTIQTNSRSVNATALLKKNVFLETQKSE